MPRKPKPLLRFLIDTREQTPWVFGAPVKRIFADGGTERTTLKEGDYSCSVNGIPLPIVIERKSHVDLLACVGRERERFERELERIAEHYQRAALIVEATADDILRGHPRSQISPRAAMASLACWLSKFGIAPIFAENHRRGGGFCQRLLEEYAAHWLERHSDGNGIEDVAGGDSVCGNLWTPSVPLPHGPSE